MAPHDDGYAQDTLSTAAENLVVDDVVPDRGATGRVAAGGTCFEVFREMCLRRGMDISLFAPTEYGGSGFVVDQAVVSLKM